MPPSSAPPQLIHLQVLPHVPLAQSLNQLTPTSLFPLNGCMTLGRLVLRVDVQRMSKFSALQELH